MPIKELDDLNVPYEPSYKDESKVGAVILPLTYRQWAGLVDMEDEDGYLGACCSNISGVRDLIIDAFRNGKKMDWGALRACCRVIKEHGTDFGEDLPSSKWDPAWMEIKLGAEGGNPWVILFGLWNVIEPHVDDTPSHGDFLDPLDPNDPEDALTLIFEHCKQRSIDNMFKSWKTSPCPEQYKACADSERVQSYSILLAAMKTLTKKIKDLDGTQTIKGWAGIIEEKVIPIRAGWLFHQDKAVVEEIVGTWKKEGFDDLSPELQKRYSNIDIRQVRVSLAKGLEILD